MLVRQHHTAGTLHYYYLILLSVTLRTHRLQAYRTSSCKMGRILGKVMRVLLLPIAVRSKTHHVCEKTENAAGEVVVSAVWPVWPQCEVTLLVRETLL